MRPPKGSHDPTANGQPEPKALILLRGPAIVERLLTTDFHIEMLGSPHGQRCRTGCAILFGLF